MYIIRTTEQDLTFLSFDKAMAKAIELGYLSFRDSFGEKCYVN
jgi:hypothetical protein